MILRLMPPDYGQRYRRVSGALPGSSVTTIRGVMPTSYDPAAWQNFYVMMGTANAAITGLVFVALSIHLREVLEHPILKPRAVLALVVLTTQIVIAAIVPPPPARELM